MNKTRQAMATPGFLCSMTKTIKMHSAASNNISGKYGALCRRTLLILALFLGFVGNVWGEIKVIRAVEKEIAVGNKDEQTFTIDYDEVAKALSSSYSSKSDLTNKTNNLGWYVISATDKVICKYTCGGGWIGFGANDADAPQYSASFENKNYVYWSSKKAPQNTYNNFDDTGDLAQLQTVKIEPSLDWQGLTVVFVFTQDEISTYDPSEWTNAVTLKWTFVGPDEFPGTFSGTEQTKSYEVSSRTYSNPVEVDFSEILSSLPNVKYARFYLVKDGEAQDISTTAISVTDGQTTSKNTRGVYVYTGETLTADNLKPTVTLSAGSHENYQLIAVFSDDDPAENSGTTVTKEPATLDVKYVCSFTYPLITKDKYIKESLSSSSFDISDALSLLGTTVDKMAEGHYIKWYMKDASDNILAEFVSQGAQQDANWAFRGADGTWNCEPYRITDDKKFVHIGNGLYPWGSFSENWASHLSKPTIFTPKTKTFADYSGYTIYCDIAKTAPSVSGTTVTSEPTPALRYIFHFNETGKKPDTFSGKLKSGGLDKSGGKVVDTPDQVTAGSTSATLNFANALALVSGVKYARFYLVKDGEAVDPTGKLTVTGGTAGPDAEHGYYIYKGGGLQASDISVSLTLTSAELDAYQVIGVFSTGDAPSGTPLKESDWDLKYTYSFEYPFKGDATSATAVAKSYQVTESKKAETLTLAFDFANNKIKLLDGSDAVIDSHSISASSTWSAISSGGTLNGGQPFYVRWFLEKSGAETYIADAIVDAGSSYLTPAKARYGLYWQTTAGGESLTDIMKIKLDASKLSDLTDYNLVCTIATNLEGETFDGSSKLTHEPNTMAMKYTISFTDAPWAGTIAADAFTHSKEVLLDNATDPSAVIPLSDSFIKILSEYSTDAANVLSSLHIRWYVTKDGIKIDHPEDYLTYYHNSDYDTQNHKKKSGYGVYWNSKTNVNESKGDPYPTTFPSGADGSNTDVQKLLNLTFTKPDADDWSRYQVVVVLSNDVSDASGQIVVNGAGSNKLLDKEPQNLNMVYFFNFFVKSSFKFTHYRGASGRDFITSADDSYLKASVQQYYWDNDNSKQIAITPNSDIRQGVHTVTYDIYVDTRSSAEVVPLKIGLEDYFGNGLNLDAVAYVRWYDWETDMGTDLLAKSADSSNKLENPEDSGTGNQSRGLFLFNNTDKMIAPTHKIIGVTFNPQNLTKTKFIACDVSKYYDGIYPGPYMVHEPTLSVRYLFRIHPATECITSISAGQSAFDTAVDALKGGTAQYYDTEAGSVVTDGKKKTMFSSFFENKGRVIVSIRDANSLFNARADLPELSAYYVGTTSSPVQCNAIKWYSYYEDDKGLWVKVDGSGNPLALTPNTSGFDATKQNARINAFTMTEFGGKYKLLSPEGTEKDGVTAKPGMKFHFIGYVGNSSDLSSFAPACYYDLRFVEAPAYQLSDIPFVRTDEYLADHLSLAGAPLNFDDRLSSNSLTLQTQNMLETPLEWNEAHYGFCYPQIDNYRIHLGNNQAYDAISPQHGDYQLLESMNANPALTGAYKYHYWNTAELYDYTHTKTGGKFGSFIYVDASDESRTIATLNFAAHLCKGSEIHFTAAIADMTEDGKLSPQMMAHVYIAKDSTYNSTTGKWTYTKGDQIISFLVSELNTLQSGTYSQGKWYQVYSHGTISDDINVNLSNVGRYIVEIDNYSRHTNGADYCVDQITLYTSTGKLKVKQTDGGCDEQDLKLTAYIDVEQLTSKITLPIAPSKKKIYYRIFKHVETQPNGKIIYEPYDDADIYNNDGKDYGEVEISDYSLKADNSLSDESVAMGYEIVDGVVCFNIVKNLSCKMNRDQGQEYYFALTGNLETPGLLSDIDNWADPNDACDVYSDFFVPAMSYVSFTDALGNKGNMEFSGSCSGSTSNEVNYNITVTVPDASSTTDFTTIPGVKFDFFVGEPTEVKSGAGGTYDGLLEALRANRKHEADNGISYTKTLTTGYSGVSAAQYTLLDKAVNTDKVLLLKAAEKFKETITSSQTYLAIPDKKNYTVGSKTFTLCDYIPFEFTVNMSGGKPTLTLGFDDVDYTEAGAKRVIRVGLEQLNKMRTQEYKLHIPVNGYTDKNQVMTSKLYFPTTAYLTVSSPAADATAVGTKFAKIVPNSSTDDRPSVDKNHMYISLDLSGDNCAINFHEGYEYEVHTTFVDATDEGKADACIGDMFLVIKVVPEFVTWHAQHVDDNGYPTTAETAYWSANWYNDGNWQRSVRSDLYKDENVTGKKQNSNTAAHTSGYDNNGEHSLSTLTAGSNPGFVPMKFTYVTLPTGNNAPSLINEPRVVGTGKGAKRQGGGFLDLNRTKLLTDRSPNANTETTATEDRHNSQPTANIYYDMLVRYSTKANDQYGEGCFGHRYLKSDGTWDDQGTEDLTAKVFDVEKFQGNVCREIYFKPGAELLRPHRLQYEKAWVEMELDANKWYLVSAPLKDTYAGDMYVPTSMTDVTSSTTVKGRQVTEAFQPINFNTTDYSRTQYPIYQRSWGDKQGTVYVKENDIRANSYSANLNFSTVSTSMAEWGHTFNDVQVPYNTLTGFSIRAHRKNQTDKVLIRLPKADTSYEYYDWSDAASDPAAGEGIKTVSKSNINKLVSDYQDDTDRATSPLEFNISDMEQIGDYVLVGNPFMVSIDMNKFFETNNTLDNDGYWTYVGSDAIAHAIPDQAKTAAGVIKPLQAFFVKKGSATQIEFNKEMQIDGNFPTPPTTNNPARIQLVMRAANDYGSSSASIELSEQASAGYVGGEDVETLFDSNLADVPMVFTVAGQQAVSIDARPEVDIVPFGVACAASDELVDVSVDVSHLSSLTSYLYLLDAVTGDVTEVGEGGTFTVQPNDYGRYFLTTRGDPTAIGETKATESIVVSVRGKAVTVRSAHALKSVRVLTTGGAVVGSVADGSKEATVHVNVGGVYVVEAQTADSKKSVKVVVK